MPEPDPQVVKRRRLRLSEDERRAQIIDGCLEMLARDGYQHASLSRIAQTAGVSKGLISHYFANKDALIEQTALATLDFLRAEVASAVDLDAEVPEILTAAVRYASRLRETHSRELRALDQIVHNARRADGTPRFDHHAYEATYQAQEQLFKRGQQEGTLRAFDTRVMAVTYQGAIDTMLAYLNAHPDADPTAYADALTEILLRAIRR